MIFMRQNYRHRPAQIGITTVLLSIIMLYIGVSVSARILRQVQLETARTESAQRFNRAEMLIAQETNNGDLSQKTQGNDDDNESVQKLLPQDDILYVKKGETISIRLCGDNTSNTLGASGGSTGCTGTNCKLQTIYYGSNSPTSTQLLIRRIYKDSSGVTKSQQQYFANCPNLQPPSSLHLKRFYCGIDRGWQNLTFKWKNNCSDSDVETAIIMVLGDDTYIGMKGLARHYRSASRNPMGNEVRVIEQAETDPSAPGMFQFGILVNGAINSTY